MKLSNMLIATLVVVSCFAMIPVSARAENRSNCIDKCHAQYLNCTHDHALEPGSEKVCADKKKDCETSCSN